MYETAGYTEKNGYRHFMLKEIHEQPEALKKTLADRIDINTGSVRLSEISFSTKYLQGLRNIAIVACGTASHAGLVGKYLIERAVKVPVIWDLASEFSEKDPLVDERTLTIVISQSGETADTLAAMRVAKEKGCKVLAITNVVDSTIAKEADQVLYTFAGPEIAIASTKAYSCQLLVMYLLAFDIANRLGTLPKREIAQGVEALATIPDLVEKTFAYEGNIKEWAEEISTWNDIYFIGRGLDYSVAQEGQLKLKETSYLHAEAFAAGEMRHGPVALLVDGSPLVALATQEALLDKMLSNIQEFRFRGARVTAITTSGNADVERSANRVIYIPQTLPIMTPILSVVPLQFLAYYTALARGNDVDAPRNLTKAVTT